MSESFRLLFDTSSFVPRKLCGNWSAELIMLHNASDLLIWLAYLSIPLALLTVARRLRELPFRGLFLLFGAFILSCGFTHFMDVLMFQVPMYRLAGWLKLVTAVVSWATVIALIPAIPRILAYADGVRTKEVPVLAIEWSEVRARDYIIAVLLATLVLLIRAALDDLLEGEHLFALPMLAVVFVAWRSGFGPALVTLMLSMTAIVYFFVEPRRTFLVDRTSDLFALGLFLFCGFAASMLGEAQRKARTKADRALAAERTATERLLGSEGRLRAFIDYAPSGKYVKDSDGRYLLVNTAFANLVGRPPADIVGKTDSDLFHSAHAERLQMQDLEVRTKQQAVRWEDKFSLGGKKYAVLTSKFLLPDGNLGGITTDITYRKRAERTIRASAVRFRQLADAMPQMVWVTKPNGQHQFFNSRWYKYTGQTKDESYGWGWATPLHPDDRARSEATWKKATATGGKYEIEYRFRRADGQYRWFLGRAEPVRDAAGKIVRWFGTCTDIDDRKRQADDLRYQFDLTRAIAENATTAIFMIDDQNRCTYANPAAEGMTGYGFAELEGGTLHDLVHHTRPDGSPYPASECPIAGGSRRGEELRGHEDVFVRPSGEFYPVVCNVRRILRDGQPFGSVVEVRDVTDERRREAELRESESRYRSLIEVSPQVVWMARPDGAFTFLNQQWTELTGLTAGESLGLGWLAAVRPDQRAAVAERWAAAGTATGGEWNVEIPFRRAADGSYRWHLTRGTLLRSADGTASGWIGVALDIDDRKRAEQNAREAADRFQTMADSIPPLAWMTEPDGHIFWYNQRWYEYTGTTFEQMQGWGWQTVHDPAELPRIVEKWTACLAAGEPWEDIFPLRRHDGVFRRFLSRARPIRDDQGRIVRWFGTNTDIEDRLELEDRLRDAASDFRQLTEGLPQLVWACTPAGEWDYLSRQWIDYTGRPAAEQLPHGWLDSLHPDDRDATTTAWRQAVAGRGGFDVTFRLRRHDGVYHWFRTQAIPLTDAAGRVSRWVGTSTDVHDQRLNEESLRASEARFRLLTETVPNPVWNLDAAGNVTYLNRRWLDYTGTTVASVRDDGWRQVLHPDEADRVMRGWEDALRTAPDRHTDEFRIRHSDGSYRWYVLAAVALRRPDGAVDQWIGAMADVDDQKREAERLEVLVADRTADLRRQQEFLDVILNSVTDGIVACDAVGTLTLFNRASREFHGLPPESLPAERWAERFSLFRADGVTPLPMDEIPLARAFAGEWVRDAEMVIAPVDQPARTLMANGQPLADAAGHRLGAVVSMRDVTEEVRLRARERAVAAELQRSNGELEKFAYVASHDMQEPLRKIQAFGDRLKQKHREQLGEQGRDYLDRMLTSAARMRTLIEDLLSFSRISTKTQPFAAVKLPDVLRAVASDLEFLVAQTGGRVDIGPLPTVTGDPTQLRQLFQNLIANGLKFRRPDVPPVVTVTAVAWSDLPASADPPAPTGDGWRFTVSDNGIGFEQQYAERIFELFQRLHGRTEYEGTGIGLAVCRKIVDRHAGAITARGFPGAGATIILDLPAHAGTS